MIISSGEGMHRSGISYVVFYSSVARFSMNYQSMGHVGISGFYQSDYRRLWPFIYWFGMDWLSCFPPCKFVLASHIIQRNYIHCIKNNTGGCIWRRGGCFCFVLSYKNLLKCCAGLIVIIAMKAMKVFMLCKISLIKKCFCMEIALNRAAGGGGLRVGF